jgi:Leucine-rich repeat (LRR) protein
MNKEKKNWRKYTLAAVVLLLMITASLVSIYFTKETISDPYSEAMIRQVLAAQLNRRYGMLQIYLGKAPNDLNDEDFAKIRAISILDVELSDIKLLKKFIHLQRLSLSNIGYSKRNIPKWMKIMAKFGFIDLGDRFSIDLSPLEKLNSLQYLTFYIAPVKNIQPLSSLTNLEELTLEATGVCNLKPLKNLTKLRFLVISNTCVSDLKPIKDLTNIEKLIMHNTLASDLEPLKGLVKLEDLNISGTKVSDLRPLMGLKNLRYLYIEDCKNISNQQVEDLQKALSNLRIER